MMRLTPYICLQGNAREAIAFYEKALGGQCLGIMTFGDMPEFSASQMPEGVKELVAHALIKIGDTELMLADTFPGAPYAVGSNVQVCISTDSVEKSEQLFNALADGGKPFMPFGATSFSPGYGMVTDRYGAIFHIYTAGQHG